MGTYESKILILKALKVNSLVFDDSFSNDLKSKTLSNVLVFIENEVEVETNVFDELNITCKPFEYAQPTDAFPYLRNIPVCSQLDYAKVYAYIEIGTPYIRFFMNYGNSDYLLNNCEITFPSYDENTNRADYINKCTFGLLYTDKYAQNRLMISGNPDLPNCDWWTNDVNVYAHEDDEATRTDLVYNDLTYFPDENYCYYGNDKTGVVGYDVDENGRLVVFKERNEEDPTIYFREGVQVSSGDTYEYKLNMFSGNTGVYPLSNKAILNFAGRTVFLSNEKVVDILFSTDIIQDKGKYAYSCSLNIDEYIKKFDFNELKERAFLYSDEKFLYLSLGQILFAARYDELDTSTYQYEWYPLTTIIFKEDEYITTFVKADQTLYFATNKGNIYQFNNLEENRYFDIRKSWLEDGDFNSEVLNQSFAGNVKIGDRLYTNYSLRIKDVVYGDTIKVADNQYITTENPNLNSLFLYLSDIERPVHLRKDDGSVDIVEKITFDQENDRFALEQANYTSDLVLYIDQKENDLVLLDTFNEEDGTYSLSFEVPSLFTIKNVSIANFNATWNGYIEHKEFISAYFITAPFTMGTINEYKNFYSFTLTNDVFKENTTYIGITSNYLPYGKVKTFGEIKSNFGFDYEKLNFNYITFDQANLPIKAFTRYRNLIKKRYVDFVFFNEEETNMVLSNLAVVYTINNPIVGGN